MRSSNSAARRSGTASPPVNMTRNEAKASARNAGDSSSIRNWVDTAARAVTRCSSMRSMAVVASNRDITMHGAPRAVGVTCEVQMPKPNGAGTRLMNTSSAVSSPASTASSWNANHRCWSCTTTLGSPVVPDVELRRNTSSAVSHRSRAGASAGARPSTWVMRWRAPVRVMRWSTSRAPARPPMPTTTSPARSQATNAACTPGPSAICTAIRSPGRKPSATRWPARSSDHRS